MPTTYCSLRATVWCRDHHLPQALTGPRAIESPAYTGLDLDSRLRPLEGSTVTAATPTQHVSACVAFGLPHSFQSFSARPPRLPTFCTCSWWQCYNQDCPVALGIPGDAWPCEMLSVADAAMLSGRRCRPSAHQICAMARSADALLAVPLQSAVQAHVSESCRCGHCWSLYQLWSLSTPESEPFWGSDSCPSLLQPTVGSDLQSPLFNERTSPQGDVSALKRTRKPK